MLQLKMPNNTQRIHKYHTVYHSYPSTSSIDEEARKSLKNLKTKYLPSVVGEDSIQRYTLPWTPSGIDPSHPMHAKYLDDICNKFRDGITRMIDRSLKLRPEVTDQAVANLYEEVLHHAKFCHTKCRYELFIMKFVRGSLCFVKLKKAIFTWD